MNGGRIALGALLLLALGYAAVCAWLYAGQRQMVYFPTATRVAARETDFVLRHEGETLRGWVLNRDAERALLYFGGNAEAIDAHRDSFARWFPDHAVYLLAYRGYGASTGTPDEAALVSDARFLFDVVSSRHRPVDVIGRSLGSGVASQLAASRPVARLALVTPFDSLAAVGQAHYPWLPVQWLARDRYDSARHLADYRGPVLIVRAEHDTLIPADSTRRLAEALPQPPRIVVLEGAGHNGFDASPAYARALQAFLDGRPAD
ncbi:alpha/beta hydrolase [Marilutibacter aestuarii]|uniref:Lysophospholipase n=1 Tax=Marilutibacter aestuarii TaxID=1706195 RepID=A0A508ACZ3_9GAMM|nr:alpha/beta hydrolase [Lysobacter aestuarii]TQD46364.1 lysophospholipase [Lysobacter aestuarii]